MGSSNERRLLAALVALLIFTLAYLAVTLAMYALLPSDWSTEEYEAYAEHVAETGALAVELGVPTMCAAIVYKLVQGSGPDGRE